MKRKFFLSFFHKMLRFCQSIANNCTYRYDLVHRMTHTHTHKGGARIEIKAWEWNAKWRIKYREWKSFSIALLCSLNLLFLVYSECESNESAVSQLTNATFGTLTQLYVRSKLHISINEWAISEQICLQKINKTAV